MYKRLISLFICFAFIFTNFQYGQAQDFSVNQLPVPGILVGPSTPFVPLALKGLIVDPQKPLEFQFIVDTGRGPQDTVSIKNQANQLVKYFLAGLTIPEGELWVNLSPYEKDRIVPAALGQTELGRDLLAQDYILKQLTASLIYPEKDLGREFWAKVYKQALEQYGTTNVPVNTFNKVWILPDQVQVFENGNAVYVTKATLKVMLDQDYLSLSRHAGETKPSAGINSLGSQIVRNIVLPEIKNEVNNGKNFAPLRQIYQSLILAKWYKETIQNGLLDAIYTDKSKVAGLNLKNPAVKEQIYQRYLQAYKTGVFNYIKEDPTPDGQVTPRKYFSGGVQLTAIDPQKASAAMISTVPVGAFLLLTAGVHTVGAKIAVGVTLGLAALGAAGIVAKKISNLAPKISENYTNSESLSKLVESRLAESQVSVRIENIIKEWDDITKINSYSRSYIQEVKATHLERKFDLVLFLYKYHKILGNLKKGELLPVDYLKFLLRSAQDGSPDISFRAKQAIVVAIKLGKVDLDDIKPDSLHYEIGAMLNGQAGKNIKEIQKELKAYGSNRLEGLIAVYESLIYQKIQKHNIIKWLLSEIRRNDAEIHRNASEYDKLNSLKLNSVSLEYLLYMVGDYEKSGEFNEIIETIRDLLPFRDDQEQLRGAAARALSGKNVKGVDEILIGIIRTALSGLSGNDPTGKILTIEESVISLRINGRPEFQNAYNSVFHVKSDLSREQRVNELKKVLVPLVETSSQEKILYPVSAAMRSEPGGIDLNQINVNSTGKKINVQFDSAQLSELIQDGFEGFVPEIMNMRFISSPLPYLGVSLTKQEGLEKI